MLQTDRQKNTLFYQGRRMVEMNIALDDIRSKAPKFATHYRDDRQPVIYLMKRGDDFYFLESGNIRKSFGAATRALAKPLN